MCDHRGIDIKRPSFKEFPKRGPHKSTKNDQIFISNLTYPLLLEICGRIIKMSHRIDMTGQTFGRLTVLRFHEARNTNAYWWCRCECGNEKSVARVKLINNKTRSCGCLRREGNARKHGMSKSREYSSWLAMKDRCSRPEATRYERYGGRGIKICARWENSFENFLSDMGPRPENTSLDRINPDGDYEPTNCRWADPVTQTNNRSS